MNFGCLGIKYCFNALYCFTHFRKLVFHSPELCLFKSRFSRASKHDLIGRDVRCDSGLCADLGAVTDMNVVLYTDLACEHNVVSGTRASGDTDVGANQVVFSDGAVVTDLYQVVDFCSLADPGCAVGTSVDCGIRADLDVVFDFDPAEL